MRSLFPLRVFLSLAALASLLPVRTAADVLYVRADAPATGFDGKSWATACPAVQDAFPRGQAGDEVWVAAGVYTGPISMPAGWSLYGGFAGTETARDQRDPAARETVLQEAAPNGGVLTVLAGATNADVVDGFTIRQGFAGIMFDKSSPTIRGNRITDLNYGIAVGGPNDSPVITDNQIFGNRIGVYVYGGPVNVIGNLILDNQLGIQVGYQGCAVIANNVVGRSRETTTFPSGGIYTFKATVSIVNNTLFENRRASLIIDGSEVDFANNIMAFSDIAIIVDDTPQHTFTLTLRNNVVYGNQTADYAGIADPTGTDGNLRTDPRIVDRAGDNFLLHPSSPLIDAGYDFAVPAGWLDADGKPRIQGPHVDIGAYEAAQGTGASLVDAARALMATAGLRSLDAGEQARLDVETAGPSQGVVDLQDAARLARKAAGLDPNP